MMAASWRVAVVVAGAALVVGGCVGAGEVGVEGGVPPGQAGVAAGGSAFPDFDGDGKADLVYGVGSTESQVVVAYGSGVAVSFSRAQAGGPTPSADNAMGFGQGLLARDLNGDEVTDLVIVDASPEDPAVYVALGSPQGLQVRSARRTAAPSGVSSLHGTPALLESPGRLIVVGAGVPTSVAKGGALVTLPIGSDGLPTGITRVLSQRNLPGADEAGDGFGAALAADGSLLLVGAPGEDVGSVRDAGAVSVLRYRGGARFTGEVVSQASKGVPGRAERGDRFGFAVGVADGWAAVGAPFEDGTRQDTGAVTSFRVSGTTMIPKAAYSQSSKGVPGVSETADRFGWAVAVVRACRSAPGILVGAPNEAIGRTAQAGSAWLIPVSGTCAPVQLAEGARLSGAPTGMALAGASVSAMRTGEALPDTLIITAPGVSEEGVLGRVLVVPPPYEAIVRTAGAQLRLNEEGTITLSPPGG